MLLRTTLGFVCFASFASGAIAAEARYEIFQLPALAEPSTPIEHAVSSFGACVRGQIRGMSGVEADAGAKLVLDRCRPQLARVERLSMRIIERSRLPEARKAVAYRELQARLQGVETRIGERIRRSDDRHS